MNGLEDDNVNRAVTELGAPEMLFQVSRERFLAKLGLCAVLLIYGIVANYVWWVHGPATFGHFEILFLVLVPLSSVTLFWHMYRNLGLFVLIYPTGLLRLRRGEVDSLPWEEIEAVTLNVKRSEAPDLERDDEGEIVNCSLPVDVPLLKIWAQSVSLRLTDGTEASFGPALSNFSLLADEIQRRTFTPLWTTAWTRFRDGHSVRFGPLVVTRNGLRHEKKFLPWRETKELGVAQGKLSVKRVGKWLPWLLKDVTSIPNLHVFFALVSEARRLGPRPRLNTAAVQV